MPGGRIKNVHTGTLFDPLPVKPLWKNGYWVLFFPFWAQPASSWRLSTSLTGQEGREVPKASSSTLSLAQFSSFPVSGLSEARKTSHPDHLSTSAIANGNAPNFSMPIKLMSRCFGRRLVDYIFTGYMLTGGLKAMVTTLFFITSKTIP